LLQQWCPMSVKIVANNIFSRVYGPLDDVVRSSLMSKLSYRIKDAYFRTGEFGDWDGVCKLFWPSEGNKFYTGMMSVVRDILDKAGVEYSLEDRRQAPAQNLPYNLFSPKSPKEDRLYQNFTVNKCLKATRGIIQSATGAGKTYMVTKLIGGIKTSPFIFFVLSKDLLEQAQQCLSDCLNVSVGIVGDGQIDIQPVTVMTVQTAIRAIHWKDKNVDLNAYKYDEDDSWDDATIDNAGSDQADAVAALIADAKGVYFDEVHHAAARTCQEVLEFAKGAYWRFGGSATPFREDGAEMMLQALFGKTLVSISASWLIKNGYLVKPYIFNIAVPGNTSFMMYPSIYKERIVQNADLNNLVVALACKMESRNIPFLTLVQQYDHGESLKIRHNSIPFIRGDMPRKKRKQAIDDLKAGIIPGAIATTLADEGLDIERLGSAIIAGGGKSVTRCYQRVGRTLRTFPGKKRALVFLFHHKCKYLKEHGSRVRRLLAEEPEFSISDFTPSTIMSGIDDLLDGTSTSNLFASS